MVAGVLASAIESVGDYYACARLAGPPSYKHHHLAIFLFLTSTMNNMMEITMLSIMIIVVIFIILSL